MKILHFADAHIDISQAGRIEPDTTIPVRVRDFLNSLDTIVDAAIDEKVDLVLFAGDAYKDRHPQPTYQREWEKRMIKLSQAGIPIILVTGNHDLPKAIGKAHALEEFETLKIPRTFVVSKAKMLSSSDLGIPVQVLCLPWIYRSRLTVNRTENLSSGGDVDASLEDDIITLIQKYLDRVDHSLPTILVAHTSVQGASLGDEKDLNLGSDFLLSPSVLKDPRLDYVALGHIHKAQNLNGPGPEVGDLRQNNHPPVIYSGSIERVNFGEMNDKKYYVIAEVECGRTTYWFKELTEIRPYIKKTIVVDDLTNVMEYILDNMPSQEKLKDAVVHINIEYPADAEKFINENEIRAIGSTAFDFRLTKISRKQTRSRLAQDANVANLTNLELLDIYLDSHKNELLDHERLVGMAKKIFEPEQEQELP